MMKNTDTTPITKKELRQFFKKQGVDIDAFFDPQKYQRYTKEGNQILLSGIEHYTDWGIGPEGLQFMKHPNKRAVFRSPKFSSMNDFKDFDQYHGTINELRENREKHYDMIDEFISTRELKEDIEQYLKSKNTNLKDLLSLPNTDSKRNELISSLIAEFGHLKLKDGNFYIIDPNGKEHQRTSTEDMTYSQITSQEQLLHIIKGAKDIRNQDFFIASSFVRSGKTITRSAIDKKIKEMGENAFEDILSKTEEGKKKQIYQLERLHFYLSEVYRNDAGEMVFPDINNTFKSIQINDMGKQPDYYKNIQSLDEFIKKMEFARYTRDRYYELLKQREELLENRLRELGHEQDDDEQDHSR